MRKARALPKQVEDDIKTWDSELGRKLLGDGAAKGALAKLFWLGCDPRRLLELLQAYIHDDPADEEDPEDLKRKPDKLDKRVLKLSQSLAKNAQEILDLAEDPESPSTVELVKSMRIFSQDAEKSYNARLEARLPRGFKVGFLTAAAKIVQLVTGKKHFREIADILSAMSDQPHPDQSVDPSTVRMNVRNFVKRGETPMLTEEEIRAEVRSGREKWSALRRTLTPQ
jgi:hypothetical protein